MSGSGARPAVLMTGAYPQRDMDALANQYDLLCLFDRAEIRAESDKNRAEIRAIATRGDLGANAELMGSMPNLEIVSVFGVGTDSVDLDYARSHNIKVTNTPDVLTDDVADIAVALLLATARHVPQGDQLVRSGTWPQGGLPLVTRVSGKKVGIVGMGRIGAAVAKRLNAFDCEIAYFARSEREGSINADVLSALGPNGILVNVSRGTTVDEPALIKVLRDKTIKGAGLDVFLDEPNINPEFFSLDNAVLQPHHASGTVETRKAMGQLVRDNLAAHFAGKPLITPVV
jgi:lactate dehydrogenase-like 2-hydroxyacid dehydrogenase